MSLGRWQSVGLAVPLRPREGSVPRVTVVGFRDIDGSVPILEWLQGLPQKAEVKCRLRIERLEELGHELRRPEADYLRDGIYELRATLEGKHYRMLYFFLGRTAVVLSHGLVKERVVPPKAIDLAILRKSLVERDPIRRLLEEI
jgi:phage-related protein